MSSGKIGMTMTYTKKNFIPKQVTAPVASAANAPVARASRSFQKMGRFTNTVSMHTIIHTPAKGCSSCGN
jgi:hypothetical protein